MDCQNLVDQDIWFQTRGFVRTVLANPTDQNKVDSKPTNYIKQKALDARRKIVSGFANHVRCNPKADLCN